MTVVCGHWGFAALTRDQSYMLSHRDSGVGIPAVNLVGI